MAVLCPRGIICDAGVAEIVKSKLVPARANICGLPQLLLVTVRVPVLFPVIVGVKVTLIVQVPEGASGVTQVFVCAKSPVTAMVNVVRGEPPVFVSVIA